MKNRIFESVIKFTIAVEAVILAVGLYAIIKVMIR